MSIRSQLTDARLFLTTKWQLGKVQLSHSVLNTAPGEKGRGKLGSKQGLGCSLEATFVLEKVLPMSETKETRLLTYAGLPSPLPLLLDNSK